MILHTTVNTIIGGSVYISLLSLAWTLGFLSVPILTFSVFQRLFDYIAEKDYLFWVSVPLHYLISLGLIMVFTIVQSFFEPLSQGIYFLRFRDYTVLYVFILVGAIVIDLAQTAKDNRNLSKIHAKLSKVLLFFLTATLLLTMPTSAYATQLTAPTGIPISEIESRIDEIVANYMYEFVPSIAISIVKDGEIIFSRGYGYADIAQQIPVDPRTTVFQHASVGKLFVWTATMQLVEQGLIDLDNDIHEYLPSDLASQLNFRYSFTMRDLMNHSAGFANFLFNQIHDAETVENMGTLRNALLTMQPNQIFEPASAKAYSDFGSALAAFVVQYVSGFSAFADFERENILDLLGMNNTRNMPHWFGDDAFLQNMARGYALGSDGEFYETFWTYSSMYPAGSLRGTAEDLARFAIALMPPQGEPSPLFQSRNTLDLMFSPSYDNPSVLRGSHHGFMTRNALHPALGHGGGLPGFSTQFVIVPSERFGIVALTNADGGVAFIEKIVDLLIGNTMDLVVPIYDNLPNASSVAGTFVSLRRHEGNILEVSNYMLGTHLTIDAIDENTITLTRSAMGTMPLVVTYRQIAPYVFRAVSADTPIARYYARRVYEIEFIMEDGQPVRISTSDNIDYTLQTFGQSQTAFMLGMALYWGSAIFFLVMPIALLIVFLIKRNRESSVFNRLSTGLLLCGTFLALNWIIYDVRFFAEEPFIQTTTLIPHTWIGYIVSALSVVVLVASILFFIKDSVTTKRKVLYVSTVTALVLHLFVLWQWNYFVML
jgi:CubicO group peptidase (beta-lactamase class C family)